ncbi:MAG: hypothetical protein LBN23_02925, partial [Paludibacter sp.]|jgi:hypothetical protein|nr:hypothetical protein [Paludibacter sp.]
VRLERKPLGKLRYVWKTLIHKPLYTYRETILNAANLIKKRFGVFYSGVPHHNIDAYRKSDYGDVVEKVFADEILQTVENHVRSPKDIQRGIYLYYALAVKRGHFKYISRKESCVIGVCKSDYEYYLKRYNPKLFCMNDGPSETNGDRLRAKIFLEQRFPYKSSFEK